MQYNTAKTVTVQQILINQNVQMFIFSQEPYLLTGQTACGEVEKKVD